MSYVVLFIALLGVMIGYIFLAKKVGIIDKPNDRSSHTKPTVRGGGVIFPVAVIVWALLFDHADWSFVSATILMGIIGFMDDRYSLSQLPRLIIQSLGVLLVLLELGMLGQSLFFVVMAFILITGWLNTFNFMDGINGISTLYATSVLIGVYLFKEEVSHIPISLIYSIGISLIVFGYFNVRKNAVVFAGDVGSLSMGLILAFFVSNLIFSTGRWEFIIFLSVYGADSVLTILYRLKNKENIFEAHRSHLYQYLANELGWSHVYVALIYAFLQLSIIGGFCIVSVDYWSIYLVSTLVILSSIYIFSKAMIFKRLNISKKTIHG
jgi:UDP-N-acetylmuramyl pentapeptide phosphotransferase/UDP-N-acetylglucosamine-1-phosphate transferase